MLNFIDKSIINYAKKFSRKGMYNFYEKSIHKYCQGTKKNILSIGVGGEPQVIFKKQGRKLTELDINPKFKPDIIANIEDMHMIKSNSIDVFFCGEVLEHVGNPFNAVKEIYRILKKGGVVIGSVPFIFPIHDEPYDYFRFTKYGLRKLFSDFKCCVLDERNSYLESIYVLYLRSLVVGNRRSRIISFLLFPLSFLFLPIVFLFSNMLNSYHSTTAYHFIFKK